MTEDWEPVLKVKKLARGRGRRCKECDEWMMGRRWSGGCVDRGKKYLMRLEVSIDELTNALTFVEDTSADLVMKSIHSIQIFLSNNKVQIN